MRRDGRTSIRVPAQPGPPVSPAVVLAALDAATDAIVVCAARDHTILLVNATARALVPALTAGGSAASAPLTGLARAVAEDQETFTDRYAGRSLLGRRRTLDDRHYAWYLRDRTEDVRQPGLPPPELPQPDGVELTGSYQAATEALRTGGDFYDVFGPTARGTETVVVLGDVCGRGPEAAALTGEVRQTLRALRLVEATPAEMLTVLNQAMLESGPPHRFVTLVIGSIERADHGRVRLTLASGGHPPPLLLRADGTVEEVPTSGTLIGVVPETIVHPATVELAPGELCLLFSDGLIEARGGPAGAEHGGPARQHGPAGAEHGGPARQDGPAGAEHGGPARQHGPAGAEHGGRSRTAHGGPAGQHGSAGTEQFGEARLHEALSTCRGMSGEAAVERLRQLISDWVGGGARDDIAMLVVRAPSRTPLSLRGGGAAQGSPFAIDARRGDRRPRQRP
jgi:hypothetical protein